jgi:hypothetical protein
MSNTDFTNYFLILIFERKNRLKQITATQVQSVYGIANAGNSVFRDQIISNGPMAMIDIINATNSISPTISNNLFIFILLFFFQYVIELSFHFLNLTLGPGTAAFLIDLPYMVSTIATT